MNGYLLPISLTLASALLPQPSAAQESTVVLGTAEKATRDVANLNVDPDSNQVAYVVRFKINQVISGSFSNGDVSAIVLSHSEQAILNKKFVLVRRSNDTSLSFHAFPVRNIACVDNDTSSQTAIFKYRVSTVESGNEIPNNNCVIF